MQFYFKLWLESQSEDQALKILNNDKQTLDQIISVDPSSTKKYLPAIAIFYKNNNDLQNIKEIFAKYKELEDRKLLKPLQATNRGVIYNNQVINFDQLKDIVNNSAGLAKNKNDAKPTSGKLIAQSNGIEVYESNSQQACIKYGQEYGFCISKPKNIWWQSYRDTDTATFYFVFDRNKDKFDPQHVVVVNLDEKNTLTLTDAKNDSLPTKYPWYETDQFHYWESKGIPTNTFKHIPKSSEEEQVEKTLGKPNSDLEWFKSLPYNMKSRYIGWKHVLTDEQFDYLFDNNQQDLIHNYVDATINSERKKLPPNQEAKILGPNANDNLKNYYIKLTQQ